VEGAYLSEQAETQIARMSVTIHVCGAVHLQQRHVVTDDVLIRLAVKVVDSPGRFYRESPTKRPGYLGILHLH
jgi:hypothetical protein